MELKGKGRITIDGPAEVNSRVTLTGESYRNLLLWAPRPGEAFTVTGTGGRLVRARLTALEDNSALMTVFEDMGAAEPSADILLLQALPEKERMELVIEKAAELGVASIIPLKSARSISLEARDARQKKSHRWPGVGLKASRQSRSPFITEVLDYRSFDAALGAAKDYALKLALWERPGIARMRDELQRAREAGAASAAILAGPEGGFTAEEMDRARKHGFVPVSMGERILRTETAALAAIAITRYELVG